MIPGKLGLKSDVSAQAVFLVVILLGAFLLHTSHKPVFAQDFYKDKTIRFIVGQATGGGYDTYGRTIARYIGKYIPGDPTTVVDNMTGAGSLVAARLSFQHCQTGRFDHRHVEQCASVQSGHG